MCITLSLRLCAKGHSGKSHIEEAWTGDGSTRDETTTKTKTSSGILSYLLSAYELCDLALQKCHYLQGVQLGVK